MYEGGIMSQPAKRVNVRFEPDPESYVLIDTNGEAHGFQASLTGLMYNESYRGCALIILKDQVLNVDSICLVKPANLQNPIRAVVRWREDFDIGVSKVGLQYLD